MVDKVKKGFLQACINHGSLTIDSVEQILGKLCEVYGVEPVDVTNFIKTLNAELKDYDQELKYVKHPLVNKEFLVFALTFETPACKLQMHYTEADQLYFAKLLEELVVQDDYGIPWVGVYNLPNLPDAFKQRPLPKTRIQELVQKWCEQGYFLEKDDKLYLGPRMLVEYASHLKLNFADFIKDCPLCGKLVLWVNSNGGNNGLDVKCAQCEMKLHRDCIRTFLKRNSNCPACKTTWNTPLN